MSLRSFVIHGLSSLVIGSTALFSLSSAQASETGTEPSRNPPSATTSTQKIIPGERLSDWLLRNTRPDEKVPPLHVRLESERPFQRELREAVIQGIAGHTELVYWLLRLPLTGRLTLTQTDPRWLQANPDSDPILGDRESVTWLEPSTYVAVLSPSGEICMLTHAPGAHASDYLKNCLSENARAKNFVDSDWAWVVQPEGLVQRMGVQPWNAHSQDEVAPGAWIWAPARNSGISLTTSGNLGRFLSTQVPAETLQRQLNGSYRISNWLTSTSHGSASPRNPELTASDWGEIGLIQTPSARMEPAGALRLATSEAWPYTRLNVMLQPVDWLEFGFRYADIQTQLYGPDIAGSQTYKDKSLDLKLKLLEEAAVTPQIALGMRDIGGTGLFSGEYVVANKRWGNFDASIGLGWGYLGARGNVRSPFGLLSDRYNTRGTTDVGQGGVISGAGMFHGNAALFGGVQWNSPYTGLVFKAELDGNNYQSEPFGSQLSASSPINVGVVYRYSPHVDFSAAWERGERFSLGFTLHANLATLDAPKLLDPVVPKTQPLAPLTLAPSLSAPQDWEDISKALKDYTGWSVAVIDQYSSRVNITADADQALFVQERVDRAVAVLHAKLPPTILHFVFHLRERGIAFTTVDIDRQEWVSQRLQATAPSLRLNAQQLYPASMMTDTSGLSHTFLRPTDTGLNIKVGPSYSQILGGPDGFLLYELGLKAKFDKNFGPSTWLSGMLNARLMDNYAGFKYDAPSNLPRVRTYAREYVTTAALTLPLLQLTHVAQWGRGHYASWYGGMLEEMYSGFGAEWLYRPWQSKFALGLDVNHVWQRDFSQNFALRNYQVNTGHASLYWDTGWNDVQVKLSAGRYLAGDQGMTVDVSRAFANGSAIGVWATKTNVSAEQFGEGSFDKGIYIKIPFDLILPKSTPGDVTAAWTPLTRDGGARLVRSVQLFDLTRQNSKRSWAATSSVSPQNAGLKAGD